MWGTRPSRLLRLCDDAVAFDFDNVAAMKLYRFEAEVEAAKWGGESKTDVEFEQIQ